MSSDGLTLVVLLWIHEGRQADFEEFESAASVIMAAYGGRIERRIAMSRTMGPG